MSVRKPGAPLGTRREIKNLNSFKFMQQAIDFEVRWQIEQIEDGHKIQQATVLFDPDTTSSTLKARKSLICLDRGSKAQTTKRAGRVGLASVSAVGGR